MKLLFNMVNFVGVPVWFMLNLLTFIVTLLLNPNLERIEGSDEVMRLGVPVCYQYCL